ncbi:MAG: hypothetical protein QOD06_1646, partial [Candidatus Binatota bacterium]|nr:hypothetical protein [Candidatus Binatota bacterium]
FRVNPDTTKKSWDEFVHVIPKMWTQERFSYEGEFFSMPSRAVLPKPYQKPHPPMWVAVSSPGTHLEAGERGLGSLGVSFSSFADQEKKVREYRDRIRNCTPAGEFVNEQVNGVNVLYCHEDDETGARVGLRMARTFGYLAGQLGMAKEMFPSHSYPTAGLLPTLRRQAAAPGEENKPPEGLALGNPEQVIRALKKWEECGLDRVSFVLNTAETIPQAEVLKSLRLFARAVMPAFAEPAARATGTEGGR